MPTDLPPDYVPRPQNDPDSPPAPGFGDLPGRGGDVVDPTGGTMPPTAPGIVPVSDVPIGEPTPVGLPTF